MAEHIEVGRLGARVKTWAWKGLFFLGLTVLVLNPNLKRAVLQVNHILAPEALIQTNLAALPAINAQIDRLISADQSRHSEARLVAKFVLKKITYVSDYENWGNLDYWPTAEEVWAKRQEDCDGRAIFATSLLRARGFHSARLVVGLDHMWLRVNENEKDPTKPAHFVALLSPNPNFSLDLEDRARAGDFWRLAKAFLHPTALRETSTALFADIPTLRKAFLISAFLLLCAYPWTSGKGLLMVLALGLGAVNLLADWQPGAHGHWWQVTFGCILLVLAAGSALLLHRLPHAVRQWAGCTSALCRVRR